MLDCLVRGFELNGFVCVVAPVVSGDLHMSFFPT